MSIVNTLSLESNRQIKINFDGGDLSSDAGLLLIKGGRKIFCVYGKNSSLIRNRYV